MAQQERMNLGALDPQQLMSAKRSIEGDIQRYAESMNFFNKSAGIYLQANAAVKDLAESKEGQTLLLPLTSSLYVTGTVASVDQVLVDVGTGYYIEMNTEQSQEYLKRKVDRLKVNIDELQQVLRVKQNQLLQVEKELAAKMAVAQPQPAR